MSRSTPPPSAVRRVPVGATVREAYAAVLGSLRLLLRAAALPFLLSLAILVLAFMAGDSAFLSFLLMIVGFVPYTLFGVAWHRLTLLGPAQAAPATFPSWHRRHWRFLGYVMGVTGIVYLVSLPFAVVGAGVETAGSVGPGLLFIGLGLAALIGLPYVLMRLCFVFPAVAVDEQYALAHAWAHTRGQGFRLLATLFLAALPMLALIWAVGALFGVFLFAEAGPATGGAGPPPEQVLQTALSENAAAFILAQLVLAALNYVLMALMVSAISIAFRFCTGWVPAAPRGAENGNGKEP